MIMSVEPVESMILARVAQDVRALGAMERAILATLPVERDPRALRSTLYRVTRPAQARTRPLPRPRKLFFMLVAAYLFGVLVASWVTVYDGPGNAGIVVGPVCHNVGFEWRNAQDAPGFFMNACD
jgi:hypothetical protein